MSPFIQSSKITVLTSPLEINGHVVQPPDIQFGNRGGDDTVQGGWEEFGKVWLFEVV